MARAVNIEKLAMKLELKRLEIESIKVKEEEKRKTLELQAQLDRERKEAWKKSQIEVLEKKREKTKEWIKSLEGISEVGKKNALEKISAMKNPRKTRREYFAELEEKKSKESDDFMNNLLRIAKEIKDNKTREIIASSDIEDGSNGDSKHESH